MVLSNFWDNEDWIRDSGQMLVFRDCPEFFGKSGHSFITQSKGGVAAEGYIVACIQQLYLLMPLNYIQWNFQGQ